MKKTLLEHSLVNGNLISESELDNCTYDCFKQVSNKNNNENYIGIGQIPNKLFKYYSNTLSGSDNFSIQSLKNNTVYLNSPSNFNDPYDCNQFSDKEGFEKETLRFYAKHMNINLNSNCSIDQIIYSISIKAYEMIKQDDYNFFENLNNVNEIESIQLELFKVNLQNYLRDFASKEDPWKCAIKKTCTRSI